MNNRSCVDTCQQIIQKLRNAGPEGEELNALWADLQCFVDSVFLELPESNKELWVQAAGIMHKHLGPRTKTGLVGEICDLWFGSREAALKAARMSNDYAKE